MKELITNNKREVKDVFYLIALQGLNYVAPLLVLPYLMKVLGAEKFGYIGFSMAVAQYLMLIVDFGFNLSATKRVALAKGNQDELNKIFSATLYAKIVLLLLSFCILLLISLIPQFAVYRSTMLVMFLMVVGNAFLFIFLFQGLGEIKWIAIVNSIAKLSILPLTFIIVKTPDDYLSAAFLQGMVSVAAACISLFIVYKRSWVFLQKINVISIKEEMKESFPLFLSSAATSIYTASFVIILGFFATPAEVGQYSAVDRIVKALCFLVLVPVLQSFYPKVSRLSVENKEKAIFLFKRIAVVVFVSMSLIAFACFFLSPLAVNFLGDDYKGTNTLFKIMAFVPIFVGIGGVAGQLGLLAMGDEDSKLWFKRTYFAAALLALSSVFVLAHIYGSNGAAVSLLLTESMVGIAFIIGYKKNKKSTSSYPQS
jgi:polysaccharide transporter, PST family